MCLSGLRFERYFGFHPDDGRSISREVAHLNILVHIIMIMIMILIIIVIIIIIIIIISLFKVDWIVKYW